MRWSRQAKTEDAINTPLRHTPGTDQPLMRAPSLSTPLVGTCAKLAATVCIRLLTLGWTRWSIRYRQRSAAPLGLRRSRTPLTGLSVEIVLAPLRRGFSLAFWRRAISRSTALRTRPVRGGSGSARARQCRDDLARRPNSNPTLTIGR